MSGVAGPEDPEGVPGCLGEHDPLWATAVSPTYSFWWEKHASQIEKWEHHYR